MPAKPPAPPRITTPYHTMTSEEAFRGLARVPRSLKLLEKVEDRVADLTAAATPTQVRQRADAVYRAIATFRAQNAKERMWGRRPAEADDGVNESAEG